MGLWYNGDLTGSDLWPGKSCYTRRQQVEPAQPAAAASGSRTAASLDSLHLIRGHVRFTRGGACALYAAQIGFALSET